MVHHEIVESNSLFIFLIPLELKTTFLSLKCIVPFCFKFLAGKQFVIFRTNFRVEHVGVSSLFEFDFKFAHDPLEIGIEMRQIYVDKWFENRSDVAEFVFVLFTIKLERTVGDSTVIESGDFEFYAFGGALRDKFLLLVTHLKSTTNIRYILD